MRQNSKKEYPKKICSIVLFLLVFAIIVCFLWNTMDKIPGGSQHVQQEQTVQTTIEYNVLSKEETADILAHQDAYYASMNRKTLDFFMQKKDATLEEYIAFSIDQAREFTPEEQEVLEKVMENISIKIANAGMHLPENSKVSIAKSTMMEGMSAAGYTHGNTIFLGDALKTTAMNNPEYMTRLENLLAHELFHCLTRNNSEFRQDMYHFIGFTVTDSEFIIPPSVLEQLILNPDVEHHDSYATFTIHGEQHDCYLVFLADSEFEQAGDSFFDTMYTGLVDIKDNTLYRAEEASDFYDVMGSNTDYCEDPEECMATNFAYAVIYGADGLEYGSPEIIANIISYLQNL